LISKILPAEQSAVSDKRQSRKEDISMSQPFSRYLHPFDVANHPAFELEVKRAILASWASDRHAAENHAAMRKPPEVDRPVCVDDALAALRSLGGPDRQDTLQ
jgi:hypothetical protein